MTKPRISVLSLGGTISMTVSNEDGVILPTLNANDLTLQLQRYLPKIDIRATTLAKVGSPQLRISDALQALHCAQYEVENGSDGVVIVQGTDTLEETAWLLDLLWNRKESLVVTGAMRYADDAGAEGLGNLVASVRVAGATELRNQGVMVVLNDEIHLAAHVAKKDANHLQAFSSTPWGPIARLLEGYVHTVYDYHHEFAPLPEPLAESPRIPLIMAAYDDDGDMLRYAIKNKARGVVIAAMGSGHVPEAMADAAAEVVAADIPVVFATRTGAGSTTKGTYGYRGSEADLLQRGLIAAGWIEPLKARLLLFVLICAGYNMDQIKSEFARRGGCNSKVF